MALTSTFLKLLEEKRFEDITVNELCSRAMVRRATFYKHFADKYEFFTFVVKEVQGEFLTKNKKNEAMQPRQFYKNIIDSMLDFLDQNELVTSVMKSSMFPILMDVISEQTTAIDVQEKLKEDQRAGVELSAPPEVLCSCLQEH